jgi:hypothetical protein
MARSCSVGWNFSRPTTEDAEDAEGQSCPSPVRLRSGRPEQSRGTMLLRAPRASSRGERNRIFLLSSVSSVVNSARERVRSRLLQAKLLSSSQQGYRFTNAPGARFRSFSCMNPNDKVTSVSGRQLPEEFPRSGIRPQRCGDVNGQVGDDWSWRVGVARWCGRETGRREQACRLEFHPPFPIDVRPFARRLSRRHLESVSVVIEPFDKTVNPSEAKRLANHVFVEDRLDPCMGLVEHEPDSWT